MTDTESVLHSTQATLDKTSADAKAAAETASGGDFPQSDKQIADFGESEPGAGLSRPRPWHTAISQNLARRKLPISNTNWDASEGNRAFLLKELPATVARGENPKLESAS